MIGIRSAVPMLVSDLLPLSPAHLTTFPKHPGVGLNIYTEPAGSCFSAFRFPSFT